MLTPRSPLRRSSFLALLLLAVAGGWVAFAGSTGTAPKTAMGTAPETATGTAPETALRSTSGWAGGQTLSLILSAQTRGELLPCGHCRVAAGGLARRSAMIHACRDTADFVIAAEGGDIFRPGGPDPQVDAFLVGMLARLQYSVLGVGDEDLRRGVPYLKELVASHPGLEWVSANILEARTGKPVFAPYVLRRVGPHVIGFTSCLEPELWKEFAAGSPEVEVADPVEKVRELLVSMRKQCQLMVCFVHMRYKPLRSFLVRVDGIDIAVDSHGPRIDNYPRRIGRTRQVFFSGPKGRFINWVDIQVVPQGLTPRAGRTFYLRDGWDEDSTVTRDVLTFLGTREPPDSESEDESTDGERESEDPGATAPQEEPEDSGRPR